MKQKVLVARATFPDVLERLRGYFEVEPNESDESYCGAALARKLADKDGALLFGREQVDAALLAAVPRLRAVCNNSTGYNNFDLAAITAAGVLATNAPGVSKEAVADFAWALLLAAARRVVESDAWLRRGGWRGWSYSLYLGRAVQGTTLGIIGMGRIGQAIARRALGFDMRVLYHNRSRLPASVEQYCNASYADKDALLQQADHLIVCVPLSPQTRHVIGAPELRRMKRTATLVNLSRGGTVDDAALAQALVEGRIAAAGLDVFEGEPQVHPGLLGLGNAVLTPHIGTATEAAARAMAQLAADNLIAALGHGPAAGRPPCLLNPEVLEAAQLRRESP